MKQSNAKKKISDRLLNVVQVSKEGETASMLNLASCSKTAQSVQAIHRPKFAKVFELIQGKVN